MGHGIAQDTTQIGEDVLSQGKSFEIPKALVWKSYQEVRRNKGGAGYDGQTLSQLHENRDRNLYKIWNRLSTGAYFPPPVREKRIPKEDGSERILGILTVSDHIAQGAVKLYTDERLVPIFHPDSYGYRPGKSSHQALRQSAERCWVRSWVLKVDISAFFDNVRHDLIIKAVAHHQMPRWVIMFCTRLYQTSMRRDSAEGESLEPRNVGTPQGGIITPPTM